MPTTRRKKPGEGPALLSAFRKKHGLGLTEVAEALDVTHAAVIDWEKGAKDPSHPNRAKIERYTRGEVPIPSWPVSKKEAAELAAVVPHSAAGKAA